VVIVWLRTLVERKVCVHFVAHGATPSAFSRARNRARS
jgi:hypothetical protein